MLIEIIGLIILKMDKSKLSWPKSRCKGAFLHRYNILWQTPYITTEVCQLCGKKIHFKIFEGRIDNLEYIRHHMRQVLIPLHNLFKHEYSGKK